MYTLYLLTISNSRRTSFSDSPLYLEESVEEDTLKKVVPHSVATALANMVFPVPGGPTINTPWNKTLLLSKTKGTQTTTSNTHSYSHCNDLYGQNTDRHVELSPAAVRKVYSLQLPWKPWNVQRVRMCSTDMHEADEQEKASFAPMWLKINRSDHTPVTLCCIFQWQTLLIQSLANKQTCYCCLTGK